MTRALSLNTLRIALNGRELINIDATIQPGKTLTVMGPSGSGKSTLLAYIAGFLDPIFKATGKVFLGDMEITSLPAEKRPVGMLFQDPLLFPHMSVGQNLIFAIPAATSDSAKRAQLAKEALNDIGLGDFFDSDPATLSGGQKARIALIRILLSEPKALLLDEPFSKLDMALRSQVRELVFSEGRNRNLPILLVTHDQTDADAAGGAVFQMTSP